ncbi:dTMP kinase [Candidatus Peregrinibacteria bacterium]|nr:dTMP kinase [Candidatus Peregrinibacteria bacterium]
MRGIFIVLDGPDASGTTTHAKLLADRLKASGRAVLLTAEPTDGPLGNEIRAALKNGKSDPMVLQHLFTRDRAWHVDNVIEPALKNGKIVVCDRYWYSTIVYAEAQGLDVSELKKLNRKFIQPSCVIFTLPPLDVAIGRLEKRRFREMFEDAELQRKVHARYAMFARGDQSIHVIDTSNAVETAAGEIWKVARATIEP